MSRDRGLKDLHGTVASRVRNERSIRPIASLRFRTAVSCFPHALRREEERRHVQVS